jgi:hypothetical protein
MWPRGPGPTRWGQSTPQGVTRCHLSPCHVTDPWDGAPKHCDTLIQGLLQPIEKIEFTKDQRPTCHHLQARNQLTTNVNESTFVQITILGATTPKEGPLVSGGSQCQGLLPYGPLHQMERSCPLIWDGFIGGLIQGLWEALPWIDDMALE